MIIQIISKEFFRICLLGSIFLVLDGLAWFYLPKLPIIFFLVGGFIQLITTLSIGSAVSDQGYVILDLRSELDKEDEQLDIKLDRINNSKLLLYDKVEKGRISKEEALETLETLEKLLDLPKHKLLCQGETV